MSGNTSQTDSFEELLPFVAGFAVALPTFPGFLLCVPGLVLAGLALIPIVVPALVLAVAAAVLTPPWLIGRATWRALSARRESAREPEPVMRTPRRDSPGAGVPATRRSVRP